MKDTFARLVQKCICLDFLINALILSNSYQHINLLSTIKEENLRNIKFICYLYKYIFKDDLTLDDMNSSEFNKYYKNNLNELLQLNLNILSDLEVLKKYTPDTYSLNLLQALIYSYFNFMSSIQYFCPPSQNNGLKSKKNINLKNSPNSKVNNNIRFFNISNNTLSDNTLEDISIDYVRETSISAINIFFNYSLIENQIIDEYYEIFFENNSNNKFYQYFFKTSNRIFKVRILAKTGKIFYIYQSSKDNIKMSSPATKASCKNILDIYLQEKFGDEFANLLYDKNYINTHIYENLIENYKFKYNYKDNYGKVNFNKGFYIIINTISLTVQEISLF